jgi:polyisoprenoid-binding protein YceI
LIFPVNAVRQQPTSFLNSLSVIYTTLSVKLPLPGAEAGSNFVFSSKNILDMQNNNTTTWGIDQAHSELQFKVKHLMISTVTGTFQQFSGTIIANENFSTATISFEAEVNSIFTGNTQRDGHLKSADFFDADQYPKISFTSTSFLPTATGQYQLEGMLSLHGITQPVALEVSYGGTTTDPYGNTKAGFELAGKINRKDFGLTWGAVTEAGGVVVADEVKILANIQLIKTQ